MNANLSANETTLLAAGIAAVTSVITTILVLRFGPNYKQQIESLNIYVKAVSETLVKVFERQSSITEMQTNLMEAAQQKTIQEAAERWQPTARIEDTVEEAYLIVKLDREFKIQRLTMRNSTGAVTQEFPKGKDWDTVQSRGFRIPLDKKILADFWNGSEGPRMRSTTGGIGYELHVDGQRRSFTLPVMLTQEFRATGSGPQAWIKVSG